MTGTRSRVWGLYGPRIFLFTLDEGFLPYKTHKICLSPAFRVLIGALPWLRTRATAAAGAAKWSAASCAARKTS